MKQIYLIFIFQLVFSVSRSSNKTEYSSSSYGYASSQVTPFSEKSLTIKLNDGTYRAETVIAFKKGCSVNYQFTDGDAPYPSGGLLSLTSLTADNKNMAFNYLPEVAEKIEVRLNILAQNLKPSILSFTDLPIDSYTFTLVDNYLNVEKQIAKNFAYPFQIDRSVKASFGTKRFTIVVEPLPKLPSSDVQIPPFDLSGLALAVYPNPASDFIKFTLGEYRFDNIQADLYSASGVLLKRQEVTESTSIDVHALSPGVYVIMLKRAKTGKEIYWARLIKQ